MAKAWQSVLIGPLFRARPHSESLTVGSFDMTPPAALPTWALEYSDSAA